MLINLLKQIGLSTKEGNLYLVALRFGSAPASALAKYADLNRTTTYSTLEGLVKKGIFTKVTRAKIHYFAPIRPEDLIVYLEKKEAEIAQGKQKIKESLPSLKAVQHPSVQQPLVSFYSGIEELERLYEDTLKSTSDVYSFCSFDEIRNVFSTEFWDKYHANRLEKKIKANVISPKTRANIQVKKKTLDQRNVSLLPSKTFNITPEIKTYDNKTVIISWREKMGILIESEEVADTIRQIFKLAEKGAKD